MKRRDAVSEKKRERDESRRPRLPHLVSQIEIHDRAEQRGEKRREKRKRMRDRGRDSSEKVSEE